MNPFRFLAFLSLAILALSISACSERLTRVQGKLLVDGKPVTSGGTVQFCPIDKPGRPASGVLMEDGSFTLSFRNPGDGLPPGEYKVVIIADIWKETAKTKQQVADEAMLKKLNVTDNLMDNANGYLIHVVPPEYNRLETTPRTHKVEISSATLEIVLDIPSTTKLKK